MNILRTLRSLYLTHFSQPAADRTLYRLLRKQAIRSVVEVGLGDHQRTIRLLDSAELLQGKPIEQLVVLDLFDARPVPALSIKRAHQVFARRAAKLRFIPGEPAISICRTANTMLENDLLIIRACVDWDSLAPAWTYMPRMLHANSVVFVELPNPQRDSKHPNGDPADQRAGYKAMTYQDIVDLANKQSQLRRAA